MRVPHVSGKLPPPLSQRLPRTPLLKTFAAWAERLERGVHAFANAALTRIGGSPGLRAVSVAIIPLALSPWLYAQLLKELQSPLFRDAAQCQFSGWCILHGIRLYKDVGAPDGPLIHFLHAFLQLFGGSHDHGFRRADLGFQVVVSGAMGAALAPSIRRTRLGAVLTRASWAWLAVALWLAWYFWQGWAHTIQRDAYFALLGYAGLVFVYASADFGPRAARWTAFAGGVLCALLVFSRHSGIVFPASAALMFVFVDDPLREQRRERLKATLLGLLVGLGLVFVGLLLVGSVSGFWFWYFEFPFTFYRWVAKQNAFRLFTETYWEAAEVAIVSLVGIVVAVAVRALPRRAVGFAFAPMLLLIAACIEGKGWPNHVQQTLAVEIPLDLLILSELWKYASNRERWRPAHALVAALGALFVAYEADKTIHLSPYLTLPTPQPIDADIVAAKKVGDYLKVHTVPDDRIFMYGHESHVYLNAERGPAVPYYVNLSLNIETLYRRTPPAPGEEPDRAARAAITALQHRISADACRRLKAAPPAAMVFLDYSFGIFGDGRADVIAICPAVKKMLAQNYEEQSLSGVPEYHVYLRRK